MKTVIVAEGVRIAFPFGCKVRLSRPWHHWIVGSLTPGFTTPNGVRLNAALQSRWTRSLLCHEAVHYWQARRRMGPLSYWLTYIWHCIVNRFDKTPGHVHATHMMEEEARRHAAAMVASIDGNEFDTETYLALHLPALR